MIMELKCVYHLELQPLKILELYSEYESCNNTREIEKLKHAQQCTSICKKVL